MNAREGWCNHFTGTQHNQCAAGISYSSVRRAKEDGRGYSIPCLAKYNDAGASCDKLEWPTAEQLTATEAEDKRHSDCFARGVSPCCEAPIDKSQVITEGRHKGHGPRYCSKCGKCILIV